MRVFGYTMTATLRRPGWWAFSAALAIYDRCVTLSGTFWYSHWCVGLRWDGR